MVNIFFHFSSFNSSTSTANNHFFRAFLSNLLDVFIGEESRMDTKGEMSMLPPARPGFSLRVKLFSPDAARETDRPLRCFRVVASPNLTIEDFCEKASRIHETNYGGPLSIRKCMDDELFDVFQGDEISALFANMATIRIIQDSVQAIPRASVPPSSGLRYEPGRYSGLKRERERSPDLGGRSDISDWPSSKRQRLTGIDRDAPMLSREGNESLYDNDEGYSSRTFSGLQRGVAQQDDRLLILRDVRDESPRVLETPSPTQSPSLRTSKYGRDQADYQEKSARAFVPETLPQPVIRHSHPPNSKIQQSMPNGTKGKSANFQKQNAAERGTSNAATSSPVNSTLTNGSRSTNKRSISDTLQVLQGPKTKRPSRAHAENDLEDNIESDEEHGVAQDRSASSKFGMGISSQNLDGTEYLYTPPARKSRSRDLAPSSGELPLTPARKESEKLKKKAERESGSRHPAAESIESRKREDEKARKDETKRLEEKQTEAKEKQELFEKIEQNKEEEETGRRKKESKRESKLAAQVKIEQLAKEEAQFRGEMKEAEKQRQVEDREDTEKTRRTRQVADNKEELRKAKDSSKKPRSSLATSLDNRSSPAPPARPSSTSLVPSGRKPTIRSSPLAGNLPIMETPGKGVGIEDQVPLPKSKQMTEVQDTNTSKSIPVPPSKVQILTPSVRASSVKTSATAAVNDNGGSKPHEESNPATSTDIPMPQDVSEGTPAKDATNTSARKTAKPRIVAKTPIAPPKAIKKTPTSLATPGSGSKGMPKSAIKRTDTAPKYDTEHPVTEDAAKSNNNVVVETAKSTVGTVEPTRDSAAILPPRGIMDKTRNYSSTHLKTVTSPPGKVPKAAPVSSQKHHVVAKPRSLHAKSDAKQTPQSKMAQDASKGGGDTPGEAISISSASEESSEEDDDEKEENVKPQPRKTIFSKLKKEQLSESAIKREAGSDDEIRLDSISKRGEAAKDRLLPSSSSSSGASEFESVSEPEIDTRATYQSSGASPDKQTTTQNSQTQGSSKQNESQIQSKPLDQPSRSKNTLKPGSNSRDDTQAEIDQQLTSSMRSASGQAPNSILPPLRNGNGKTTGNPLKSSQPQPRSSSQAQSHTLPRPKPSQQPHYGVRPPAIHRASLHEMNESQKAAPASFVGSPYRGNSQKQLTSSQIQQKQKNKLKELNLSDDEEEEESEFEESEVEEVSAPIKAAPPAAKALAPNAIGTAKVTLIKREHEAATTSKTANPRSRRKVESSESESPSSSSSEEDEVSQNERRAAADLQRKLREVEMGTSTNFNMGGNDKGYKSLHRSPSGAGGGIVGSRVNSSTPGKKLGFSKIRFLDRGSS